MCRRNRANSSTQHSCCAANELVADCDGSDCAQIRMADADYWTTWIADCVIVGIVVVDVRGSTTGQTDVVVC